MAGVELHLHFSIQSLNRDPGEEKTDAEYQKKRPVIQAQLR